MDKQEMQEWERVIDLSKYLPSFLNGNREFGQICESEEKELLRLYEKSDRIWQDGFIQSATLQGIKRWESLSGLKPFPGDSLEERRAGVLGRWNQQLPYTLSRLKERLNAIVGAESAELNVRYDAYELELLLTDQTYRVLQEVRGMVKAMIPANLYLLFVGRYPVNIPVETDTESSMELCSEYFARYNRKFLLMDRTWLLDGTYKLNGYKEITDIDLYPAILGISGGYDIPVHTDCQAVASAELYISQRTETDIRISGSAENRVEAEKSICVQSDISMVPAADFKLTVEKDLWHLDGMYMMDGAKLLDAEIFEYDL